MRDLVAVVTGASRGIGRGVAHELGRAGATVFVTGRGRDGAPTTDGLPGTIESTARLVDEAGGRGVAVPCDHTDPAQVDALAAAVRREAGRVDVLVNAVWGGYEAYDPASWTLPLWEQPVSRLDRMLGTGVRAHYLACRALAPLLLAGRTKLVVSISAGDRGRFLGDVPYDLAKAAVDRLVFAVARKLRGDGVHAVSLHPGLTRTERVERHAGEAELATADSPRLVGRAVVALARDPAVAELSGRALRLGDLAPRYGLVDVDGRAPVPFAIPDDL